MDARASSGPVTLCLPVMTESQDELSTNIWTSRQSSTINLSDFVAKRKMLVGAK